MPKQEISETQVYKAVTAHLEKYHSDLIWHWDLAGVNNPSKVTRALYSQLNDRGWPDLVIDEPRFMPGTVTPYHGLRIEVKAPGVNVRKRNGEWASEVIAHQAAQIARHRDRGYVADFAGGTEEVLTFLHSYLGDVCPEHANDDGLPF